ncbi:BTB/POZ domain plant protein [Medicago truncatula]|uniref:BTB/POZ domain plant protein n=2 Tax=Medicago truncatula TaxID=3880 RepID=G7K4U5_MEDTR|nr:BTB/POZ domain plant protein [Medicago truncatula]
MFYSPFEVESVGYVAQWRLSFKSMNMIPHSFIHTSEAFKISKWNWHISFSRDSLSSPVAIKLYAEESTNNPPIASFKFRILDSIGKNGITFAETEEKDKLFSSETDAFNWEVDVQLPDVTTSCVEVEFLDLKTSNPNDGETNSTRKRSTTLVRMLRESIHTDATIKLGSSDKIIRVHRAVLAARSPIFEYMFAEDSKENNMLVINISDMSPEVCQAFIDYLYDNIDDEELADHSFELLVAAEKYGVIDLREECEKNLQEDINRKNILERLHAAYFYQLPYLKISCAQYLVEFGKIHEIWDDFLAFLKLADDDVICEIFREFLP